MKFSKTTLLALLFALPFSAKSQVGDPAPNFTVTDTDGQTHTLYDYLDAGKNVVLDFFFTTCGPCQFYSPQVNLAYEKYGCNMAKTIFVSIDYDDTDAEVEAYDATYSIDYPSVSGKDGGGNAVVSQYGIFSFPTFYLIDGTKKIIEKIDPPTLQVFDFRFSQHGILPTNCVVKTGEIGREARLEISPNPLLVGENLRVRLPGFDGGAARFDILDLTGKMVETGEISDASESVELKTNGLPTGLFLLKIRQAAGGKIWRSLFVVE